MLALPFIPFCVYAILVISEKKDLSVTFVDVGQGDSAVIELPDSKDNRGGYRQDRERNRGISQVSGEKRYRCTGADP